jgi:hypothetical protein
MDNPILFIGLVVCAAVAVLGIAYVLGRAFGFGLVEGMRKAAKRKESSTCR